MFKRLTVQFLQTLEDSAKTGDTKAADPLTVPGSQARGADAVTAEISAKNGKNFIATSVSYDDSTWRIRPSGIVDVTYSVVGHEAAWPSLRALESDHVRGPFHLHLEFEDFNGTWLIDVYR